MKIVIKNKGKKEILKFPKNLNLEEYKTRLRMAVHVGENISGYSLSKYATKWFLLPKGNALFKSYDMGKETRDFRLLNELLCQELAKQVGMSCATYEPCMYKGTNGLVTYNVVGENERLVSGYSLGMLTEMSHRGNNLRIYEEMLSKFESVTREEREVIIKNLYKQALFDLMTFQTDRHCNNVFFIQNEKTRKFRSAPMIDNEFAFCGALIENENLFSELPSPTLEVTYLQFANRISMDMMSCATYYKNAMRELCRVANRYDDLKKDIIKNFSKIDVKKALEDVEKKGVIPNEVYKEHVVSLGEFSKEVFAEVFEIKTKEEKPKGNSAMQDDGMGM